MIDSAQWSWPVFLNEFWCVFGRMMACFSAVFLASGFFADSLGATFESALIGLLFAVICSAVYGYSQGDDAVREWRNNLTAIASPNGNAKPQFISALIDEPSPYAEIEVWQRHLNDLRALPDEVLLRSEMIQNAEQMIARKRRD